ncbi:MAG: hypothetical protein ACRC0F_11180 [Cetobacterium sp.]
MKKYWKIILFTIILAFNTGCSAIMAASGEDEVELHFLKKGDSKNITIAKIGKNPIITKQMEDDIEIQIFKLRTNDEPCYPRAAAYVLLDSLTLCLAEVFTTPIELVKGSTYYLKVNYKNDKFVNYELSDKKFKDFI